MNNIANGIWTILKMGNWKKKKIIEDVNILRKYGLATQISFMKQFQIYACI